MQIGTSDYCIYIYIYIVGALYTWIALGNHPVPVELQRIFFFFESVRQGVCRRNMADNLRDLGFTVSPTEDQLSRIFSPCSNQVRSTWTGFSFFKAGFQESEHDDDSFRFLKNRMSASPHGSMARFCKDLNASFDHCFNLIIDNTS